MWRLRIGLRTRQHLPGKSADATCMYICYSLICLTSPVFTFAEYTSTANLRVILHTPINSYTYSTSRGWFNCCEDTEMSFTKLFSFILSQKNLNMNDNFVWWQNFPKFFKIRSKKFPKWVSWNSFPSYFCEIWIPILPFHGSHWPQLGRYQY